MATRKFIFRFNVLWGCLAMASFLSFACPLYASQGPGETAIIIDVKSTAEAEGDYVFLGDIARIQAPDFFKKDLAGIEITRSPRPGRLKRIQGTKILSLLRARGLEDGDVKIHTPKQVFIKRKSQELKETKILKALDGFLSGFFIQGEFKVKAMKVRGLEPYPQGRIVLDFDDRYTPGDRGRFTVYADVLVDGVKQDRITVKGRVALYQPVVCAARPLKKGGKIHKADVETRSVNVLELRSGHLDTIKDVADLALVKDVSEGEYLTRRMFKKLPVVHKGDVIKIVARKSRLSIVTLGVCKEDGYADQAVWVENLNSGKVVRGLVRQDATVEVLF